MKKLVLILAFFVFVAGCNKQNEINVKSINLPEGSSAVVIANNSSGILTFKKITKSEEVGKNIMFSPLSMNIALVMTLNGAQGETADQMRSALQLDNLSTDLINECLSLIHI